MKVTNRNGSIHDTMFGDLSEFAQHQKDLCNFRYENDLMVNGQKVADIEDIRIVFTTPGDVQLKCRVSKLDAVEGIATLLTSDDISIKVKPKEPSKEPEWVITVEEFFEEESEDQVKIAPNKWLYIKGDINS